MPGSEKIWFKDLENFFTQHNYSVFFPSKSMSFAEQLNSLMRLAIYFSIFVFLLKKDTQIFFVPIFVGGFTWFLYNADTQNKLHEKMYLRERELFKDENTGAVCATPSHNNPFMNVLMNEYSQNPMRAQACDLSRRDVKRTAKKHFDNNLYRDVDDIFQKNASDRSYYTMPSTTIPNDRESYLKFLYPLPKTCKEGDGSQCYKNGYRPINT